MSNEKIFYYETPDSQGVVVNQEKIPKKCKTCGEKRSLIDDYGDCVHCSKQTMLEYLKNKQTNEKQKKLFVRCSCDMRSDGEPNPAVNIVNIDFIYKQMWCGEIPQINFGKVAWYYESEEQRDTDFDMLMEIER